MPSKGQSMKTGQTSPVSNTEEAFQHCKATCMGIDKCPYSGNIPYQLTLEGLKKIGIEGKYAGMIFTYKCPLFEEYALLQKRKQRVSRVLGPLATHTFENFDSSRNTKAFQMAKKYIESKAWKQGGWLILYGSYGTGKTHLLSAIIHEAIMLGASAKFANLANITTLDFESAKSAIADLTSYDLVGIDDFGVEIGQNWLSPHIFRLFDDLNESSKGIVMTTNMPLGGLQELLGNRIADRIAERAIAIELTGESMRKNLRSKFTSWFKE